MGEEENRRTAERIWELMAHRDWDGMASLLADDFVEEWPQSGERIRGRDNVMAINTNYPGLPTATIRRTLAAGDLVVTEVTLDYHGHVYNAVSIFEFRDGKIARETDYFAEPFDPPAWRAQWVERT
jgi:ketosteroid isomerase-like protein